MPYRLRALHGSSLESFDLAVRQQEGHTDIPRLREGGISAQFLAAYVPSSYEGRGAAPIALEQIELIHRIADLYPELELARTAEDVRRIAGAGRIAILAAVEGGHALDNSLDVLQQFAELGVRYLTLTHSGTTDWADSATDAARHGGLTGFGVEVVREMNRLGMLVDISHVSDATMDHVLRVSRGPVIASHSGARAINDHPRNVPDDVLRRVAESGGLVMVVFFSGFVVPEAADVVRDMFDLERQLRARHGDDDAAIEREWRAHFASRPIPRGTVAHVVDHVDHIVRVAGVKHVGLGSDFDGTSKVPEGLDDVSGYPAITAELVRRGYTDDQVLAILGGNVLRVLEDAEIGW
ncbi:MAG: membrane dipeptidase [Gemmatimonadetes bacterium]|uniref:Membrane dipeptidase n=1 Tax=Candidatus Kutchimonas denitrificans TaxID=3056748 RepID=A0AAE4Z8B0_9BACT|nr:membrane dipeptidase [Gemmatimonadota bacterium]NIR74332.1 membrane dipeptidase [Candidatus Kutchimonas denitrificans]NIS02583.1 membrane dipeptidase [Gemmatimonadota bacterium]NIT68458.1 membrane dipeptidase [Gemmatimonadota bacterium]NIU51935.1 membrane dipeptidase [Gemmatimonadota bacterium]